MTRFRAFSSLPALIAGLVLSGSVGAAPSAHLATAASGAKISAHLTREGFPSTQASSVKLVYWLSKASTRFSYKLTRRSGAKWKTVKSVTKKGHFSGSKSMTVKRLFAGKAITLGSYRLKLSTGEASKRLSFRVIPPLIRPAAKHSAIPVTVAGIANAVMVDAGYNHTCAVLSGGTVECWGENGADQLGDGVIRHNNGITDDNGIDFSVIPVQVSGITSATEVDVGTGHSCALLSSGAVDCWGANGIGQLGDGTTKYPSTPVQVTGIANAVRVSAGEANTCAVLADGSIECWGAGFEGQLGNGTDQNSPTPVQVVGITNAVDVSVGRFFSCAVMSTGTVECWGDNASGQLGDGLKDHGHGIVDIDDFSPTPVEVSGITTAIAVTAGVYRPCALLSNGTVQCWGSTGAIKLSDAPAPTPVAVSGMANATALSAGWSHTCARLASGSVECWGANVYGELGDGTGQNSLTPVQVIGITDATNVGAGFDFTCAALSSGSIKCWGRNNDGQLGSAP